MLNPYSIRLNKTLVFRYVSVKQYDNALEAMKKELEDFPKTLFGRAQGNG